MTDNGIILGPQHQLLRFPPLGNRFVVGIATADLLQGDQIDVVIADLEDTGRSDLLDSVLIPAVNQANSNFFRFHLTTLHEDDHPRFCDIQDDLDLGLTRTASIRKLSMIIPLRVRTPDRLLRITFPAVDRSEDLTAGSMVMFPAYLTPVFDTSGKCEVKVVTTHALGDAFK